MGVCSSGLARSLGVQHDVALLMLNVLFSCCGSIEAKNLKVENIILTSLNF